MGWQAAKMPVEWQPCSPQLRSRSTVSFSKEQHVLFHFVAAPRPCDSGLESQVLRHKGSAQQLVQCWTNLPVFLPSSAQHSAAYTSQAEEDGSNAWHAIDVGRWPPADTETMFLAHAVEVDTTRVARDCLEDGDNAAYAQYSLTWRVMDCASGRIEWLGLPDEDNATITLVLAPDGADKPAAGKSISEDAIEVTVLGSHRQHDLLHVSVPEEVEAGLVIEQTKPTWHAPRCVHRFGDVSDCFSSNLVAVLSKRGHKLGYDHGRLTVYVPVCTSEATVSLIRQGQSLKARHKRCKEGDDEARAFVVVGHGQPLDIHNLMSTCMRKAQELIGEQEHAMADNTHLSHPILLQSRPLDARDGALGVCTWEALGTGGIPLTLSSVNDVLAAFDKRAPGAASSLLIDDGWQDVHRPPESRGQLCSFDADRDVLHGDDTDVQRCGAEQLPRLTSFITQIRELHPHICHIGAWMTLAGYWDGLCPDDKTSTFPSKYGPLLRASLRSNLGGADRKWQWWLPSYGRLSSFYDDYFRSLKLAGVSFVKVDDQADWDWITHLEEIQTDCTFRAASVAPPAYYQQAWHSMARAAAEYFGPHGVLHCMALGKQLLNGPMALKYHPHNAILPMYVRTSDDTFPDVPAAHTWHIYNNAMEATLARSLASVVVPDADMVTTQMATRRSAREELPDWAEYHVAFRACFSSATIWISDKCSVDNAPGSSPARILRGLLAGRKTGRNDDNSQRPSKAAGALEPVQIEQEMTTLPTPSCIFSDLTNATNGPVLKLITQRQQAKLSPQTLPAISLLSMWNTHADGALAIDVVTRHDLSFALREDLDPSGGDLIVARSFQTGSSFWLCESDVLCERYRTTLTSTPALPVALGTGGWDIITIARARSQELVLATRTDDIAAAAEVTVACHIACVGLIDKYVGAMALVSAVDYPNKMTTDSTAASAARRKGGAAAARLLYECHVKQAGRCAFCWVLRPIQHASSSSTALAHRLALDIDGVRVAQDCIEITSAETRDKHTAVVDMVKHLEREAGDIGARGGDGHLKDVWTIKLYITDEL